MKKYDFFEEEEIDKIPKSFWFLKIIIGLVLILSMVVFIIPYNAVKINPEPEKISSKDIDLNGILPTDYTIPKGDRQLHIKEDINNFVTDSDPIIKAIADRIVVKSCSYQSKECQAKAIFYFVRDNMVYIPDPINSEYVKYPLETLINGGGDCDDLSVLTASLLGAVGLKTDFIFVPNHVYLKVYVPEKGWFYIDPTCNNCQFGEKVR